MVKQRNRKMEKEGKREREKEIVFIYAGLLFFHFSIFLFLCYTVILLYCMYFPLPSWPLAVIRAGDKEKFGSFIMPKMVFVSPDGSEMEVDAPVGLSILDIARKHDISLEGACEGSLACSTCHVIVDEQFFDQLDEPSEDEEDMLDLAFGLTSTSRLGCQIKITEDLDGLRVKLPAATRNMSVASK